VCKIKFRDPYKFEKFEKNDEEEEDIPLLEIGEIEEEDVCRRECFHRRRSGNRA